MSRHDQLWLAGSIWLGLGIADDSLILKVMGCGAFLIVIYERSRQTPPGGESRP